MDMVTELTINSLNNYFNTLSKFGYTNYIDVSKVLILTFFEEILKGKYSTEIITKEDYNSIINAIYVILEDRCIMDLPNYTSYLEIKTKKI